MRRLSISALVILSVTLLPACASDHGDINPAPGGGVASANVEPSTTQAADAGPATNANQAGPEEHRAQGQTRPQGEGAPKYETIISESKGVITETRIYRNDPHIAKVVITTRDGKRTATVYNARGQARQLPTQDLDETLRNSGEHIADTAGLPKVDGKAPEARTSPGSPFAAAEDPKVAVTKAPSDQTATPLNPGTAAKTRIDSAIEKLPRVPERAIQPAKPMPPRRY